MILIGNDRLFAEYGHNLDASVVELLDGFRDDGKSTMIVGRASHGVSTSLVFWPSPIRFDQPPVMLFRCYAGWVSSRH